MLASSAVIPHFLQADSLCVCYRYFFVVLSALIGIGLFNGLLLLPVLLSIIGPAAEVGNLSSLVSMVTNIQHRCDSGNIFIPKM